MEKKKILQTKKMEKKKILQKTFLPWIVVVETSLVQNVEKTFGKNEKKKISQS